MSTSNFQICNGRQHQSKKGRIAATELSGMIKTVPRKESDRCTWFPPTLTKATTMSPQCHCMRTKKMCLIKLDNCWLRPTLNLSSMLDRYNYVSVVQTWACLISFNSVSVSDTSLSPLRQSIWQEERGEDVRTFYRGNPPLQFLYPAPKHHHHHIISKHPPQNAPFPPSSSNKEGLQAVPRVPCCR